MKNKTPFSPQPSSPLRFFALLFTAQLLYYLGFYLYEPARTWTPLGKFSLHFRHPSNAGDDLCAYASFALNWRCMTTTDLLLPWFEMAMGENNFLKRANCFLLSSHGEQPVGLKQCFLFQMIYDLLTGWESFHQRNNSFREHNTLFSMHTQTSSFYTYNTAHAEHR